MTRAVSSDRQLQAALASAEQALRETQRQYRELFEFASVGIYRSTSDGRILFANPALARMLRYDHPDELRALDLARDVYVRPADREALVAKYGRSAAPWTVEVEWRRRDGSPIWVQMSAHMIPDDSGQAQYFEAFVTEVTERRASEDLLRLSEARYRTLVANLPGTSVFLFDHDLRYVLVDGSALADVGLSKETIEGRTVWDLVPRPLADRLAARRRQALAGTPVQFEETYNGRVFAVQFIPIRDDAGQVIYGMGVARDITERRQAEEALRESETRLRAIIDAEPECVKLVDRAGRLLEMNPAGLAMIEADTLRDVLGHDMLRLVAPEYREAFGGLAQRVFEGHSGTLEFELIGLRGGRRWVDTHAVPLRTPQGEITALLAITRDVTERKLAEQALRDSETRLRIVTRATNDAVWDWDLVTNAVWWGEGLQTLFGYEPAEVEPTVEAWYRRLHPDDHARVVASIRGVIESGRPFWTAEYRFRRRDGSYADVYDRGYVMHGPAPQRRAIRMVGSMMDVSDRKRAEKRLQSSRAALRQLATREQDIREDERTRIAREIHDSLGQALTALKLDLAAAHAAAANGGAGVPERLAQTALLVDDLVKGVRRIATELRPAVLDELGLPAAVEWLARDFSRRTGITCQTRIAADEAAISKDVATALFRIVQESLTNVSRHAAARTVTIDLGIRSSVVTLEICDDGGGITDAEASGPGAMGILGMRERAAALGGVVEVGPRAGGGTRVATWLPAPQRRTPPGGTPR